MTIYFMDLIVFIFIAGWRDVDNTPPRSVGKLKILEELFAHVKKLRPADAPLIKGN